MVSPEAGRAIRTQRGFRALLEQARDLDEVRRLDATEIPKWSGPMPPDVAMREIDAGGVPAELLLPDDADERRVLLYAHGGGFIVGSPATVRTPVAKAARLARARALVPRYRLAPEHPYPAGVEDFVTAYRWLLATGHDPSDIVLAGESAGGTAVCAALIALRDAGDPLPAGAVPISPAVDFECRGESWTRNADADGFVHREGSLRNVATFLAGADPATASPLHAELYGLPPLLVLAGGAECSVDGSIAFCDKARDAGVDAAIRIWDGMPHLWQNFSFLPEATEAIQELADFVIARTAPSDTIAVQ